jgi:DNA-binding transcriptional LysR family regulator
VELRELRYFIVVAEELHFRRAAERLHMSQPPLSQQIRKLEHELGVQLLERSSRRVRLTTAGAILLTEGRRLISHADDVTQMLRRVGSGYASVLRFAYSEVLGSSATSALLNHLVHFHPHMELRLRWMNMVALLRALHAEEVDVGLVRLPLQDDQLNILPIYVEKLLAVLPESSPIARFPEVDLATLAEYPVILFRNEDHPELYASLAETLRSSGIVPKLYGDTPQLRLDMVAAGLGVSLTAERLAESVHRPGLVFRPIVNPFVTLTSAIVWRRSDHSKTVGAFVDVIEAMRAAGEFDSPAGRRSD